MIYQVTTDNGTTRNITAISAEEASRKVIAERSAPIWVGVANAVARAAEDDVYVPDNGYLVPKHLPAVSSVIEMREVWMDAGYCVVPA